MTKEDEKLMFQELCSRLPYGIKTKAWFWDEDNDEEKEVAATVYQVNTDGYYKLAEDDEGEELSIDSLMMYLRPFNTLTDDELMEMAASANLYGTETIWLNEHHIDYNHWIERDMAIDITKDENPYKQ